MGRARGIGPIFFLSAYLFFFLLNILFTLTMLLKLRFFLGVPPSSLLSSIPPPPSFTKLRGAKDEGEG